MGERQGDRDTIDRITKRIIDSGVRPDKAHEQARQSMVRTDRQLREQGKR